MEINNLLFLRPIFYNFFSVLTLEPTPSHLPLQAIGEKHFPVYVILKPYNNGNSNWI